MLASASAIETIADALEAHNVERLVIDPVSSPSPFFLPYFAVSCIHSSSLTHLSLTYLLLTHPFIKQVMISTTGAQLLAPDALAVLRTRLVPRATILTPNVPEARLLLADALGVGGDGLESQYSVGSVADLEALARKLRRALGVRWVLVKGGHCPFRASDGMLAKEEAEREVVVDVLVGGRQEGKGGEGKGDGGGEEVIKVQSPYCSSRNTHGTGCSLACESPLFLSLWKAELTCCLDEKRRLRPTWQRAWMFRLR
jgi:hydroxymethylpyrimidine/phosphomethylpyrimidine kinase